MQDANNAIKKVRWKLEADKLEADLLWWTRTTRSPCIWSPPLKGHIIITCWQGSGLKYIALPFSFPWNIQKHCLKISILDATEMPLRKVQNKKFTMKVDCYRSWDKKTQYSSRQKFLVIKNPDTVCASYQQYIKNNSCSWDFDCIITFHQVMWS